MQSQCVTLSPEEVMSIAPDVRAKLREVITPKRVTPKPPQPNAMAQQPTAMACNIVEDTVTVDDDRAIEVLVSSAVTDEIPTHNQDETDSEHHRAHNDPKPPSDAIIIPDPIEAYLQSLPPDEIPKQLIVAKDSHALRSIFMKVHHRDSIESILDPGCQIVAMSEAVCLHLGLAYDPSIFLIMESANGSHDRSLGLARNVHCKIGGINLYLQMHVIRSPAYDILIGRPFDVLTRSIVHNYADENQTITIHDPNSRNVSTIPTFSRGRPRFRLKPTIHDPGPLYDSDRSEQDF
jgi:hypothetical protein